MLPLTTLLSPALVALTMDIDTEIELRLPPDRSPFS